MRSWRSRETAYPTYEYSPASITRFVMIFLRYSADFDRYSWVYIQQGSGIEIYDGALKVVRFSFPQTAVYSRPGLVIGMFFTLASTRIVRIFYSGGRSGS